MKKEENEMKKIAAIQDLSGYGRASLTVAIPILTHMGFQVCPLPTAVLSTHSEYAGFRSLDLTDFMEEFIAHWKELHLSFDAIYSGYLASAKQMDIVNHFFDDFKTDTNFILVDPVLGDHGTLYPNITPDMAAAAFAALTSFPASSTAPACPPRPSSSNTIPSSTRCARKSSTPRS